MGNIFLRIILGLCFISVLACKGGNLTLDRNGGGQGLQAINDQVDLSQCTAATPKGASIMGETWILNQAAGNLTQVQSLVVEDNQTTLTITCSNAKGSAQAAVHAPSTFDGTKLYHQSAPTKTVGNQRTVQCTSSLDSTPSPYTLKGNCLLINLNGQNHTFVRATALFY